ncbi:hypothetical protein H310_04550 [Aphanomyces invadans]|uniref:PA domain-containing protein n=1 Tax=Aphanomyces invadans TaxID=157072 RepID=A0A024UE84_9STRA|nr:hypothetical protein H310_04550 [Aphanomyces invadans]ETW04207.1 hypothetical protein H310_04550 [Aphanomyces invadans]|eukprot:XP_008867163.1 hypothetical protein H310_04550 [Aphanomyces invadans]
MSPPFRGLLVSLCFLFAIPLLNALVIERPCCHVERHVPARFGNFYPKDVNKLELVAVRPFDACSRIRNDIAGKVALMARGNCNFAHKVLQAQVAGAKAVVVMDSEHRVNTSWVVTMIGDAGNATQVVIPSVFVSRAIGLRLLDLMDALKLADMTVLVTLNATGQVIVKQKSSDITTQNILMVLVGLFMVLVAHWFRLGT